MTIAESVRKYREINGLTQRQLADAVGVTAQYISYLEKSQRRATDEWIKGLGVPSLKVSLITARIHEYRATISELRALVT